MCRDLSLRRDTAVRPRRGLHFATVERAEEVLARRLSGDKLADIAERHELTPSGVRYVAQRTMRRHAEEMLPLIWVAQGQGQVFALAVPSWVPEGDQRAVLRYLEGLLDAFEAMDVPIRVHYHPALDGGFAFSLEDPSFIPRPRPGGSADTDPNLAESGDTPA